MKYLMFVAVDPTAEPYDPALDNVEDWVAEMDAAGIRLGGDRLRGPDSATLVKRRSGETLVTAGPFTESAEWIAGYDLLECRDIDHAVEVASKHPMARFGRIEVRAIDPIDFDGEGFPA
jgi:hypothetical protein